MAFPELLSQRLILRLPTPDEAPAVLDFFDRNRAHLEPTSPLCPPTFYTEAYWRDKLVTNRGEWELGKSARLFFYPLHERERVIGSVSLSEIVRGAFHASYMGYGIDKNHEGQGLMTEAVKRTVEFGFNDLNLHRIMANHLPENERSARVLARVGFVREGLARDYLMIGGAWRDHVLNSITNTNWQFRA